MVKPLSALSVTPIIIYDVKYKYPLGYRDTQPKQEGKRKMEMNTEQIIKQDMKLEVEEDVLGVSLDFFKIRFPTHIDASGKVWDKVYFEEWVHRFSTGSAWVYADFETRRALVQLAKEGKIKLYAKIKFEE